MGVYTKKVRTEKDKTTFMVDVKDLMVVSELNPEEKAVFLDNIINFCMNDAEPELTTAAGALSRIVTEKIETYNKKWLDTCERNRRNVKDGRWNKDKDQEENQETPFE